MLYRAHELDDAIAEHERVRATWRERARCRKNLGGRGHRGSSAPWTPASDPTAVHWWDAYLGVGSIATGVWTAQISGVSTSQGTAGNRPTYTVSHADWGGRPAVDFDGTNDVLNATIAAFGTPCTIYVAFKQDVAETVFPFDLAGMSIYPNTGQYRMSAGGTEITDGAATQTARKFCGVMNGASSALYVDTFDTADQTGTVGTDSGTTLTIGALNGPALHFDGSITTLILATGAHSASTRAFYQAFLASRWGV
jgi:hypothetical protein